LRVIASEPKHAVRPSALQPAPSSRVGDVIHYERDTWGK
jgi:hypothetical protein